MLLISIVTWSSHKYSFTFMLLISIKTWSIYFSNIVLLFCYIPISKSSLWRYKLHLVTFQTWLSLQKTQSKGKMERERKRWTFFTGMGINLEPGEKEKKGRLQTFSGSNGVLLQRRQPALVQVPRQDLCCRSLGPNPDLPQLQQGDCNAKIWTETKWRWVLCWRNLK